MSTRILEPEIIRPLPERTAVNDALRAVSVKAKLISFLNRSTSENTRDFYQKTIIDFSRFVSKHLLTVTDGDVQAWRDWMLSRNHTNSTVAARLSILRSFYAYLQAHFPELIKVNPADSQLVPPPKPPNTLKGRALANREVKHLLCGPDRSKPEGARDYAMMLLMLRLSLRVSEVGSLRRSSIRWKDGRWVINLKVKGGSEEVWPLPPDVKRAIDEYLKLDEHRRSHWAENRLEDQYVFQPMLNHRTGRHNRGLTRQMIARIVGKWGDYARVGRVQPHDLRRTAITRALNQGMTYREVQMMSKHKDPKTVMRYDYERDNLERNPVNKLNYEEGDT